MGIIGALIGGWLLGVLGFDTDGSGVIVSFITALIGACILLFGVKAVTRRA
ncbi:GlsB/YeaQ/YmgE family stress response membrane protein [Phycicoccus sp. KQZ13P-1]|uniref:GlsB/YeaQ/YmgE family stress response membrane protein n=1 Tax=Phycicoccus mangrovi TaxID=2840470 RepID=UPI001C004824|nr:GlsB/YeaQ/YmgE family stress response membrane protein [Phycicoccus mangrovi]MBT9256750.1 GlsB/YeaQ/YmgE family stress response membrane protein [Phycicoccus mangrovi]